MENPYWTPAEATATAAADAHASAETNVPNSAESEALVGGSCAGIGQRETAVPDVPYKHKARGTALSLTPGLFD